MDVEEQAPYMESCLKVVQSLVQESSLVNTYSALNMVLIQQSLSIPDAIWAKPEPALREKINVIKAEVRKKKQESTSTTKLPGQYPMSDTHEVMP